MGHDGGVALADARGLGDDQIEAGQLAGGDGFRQGPGDLAARVAGGERAHVDVGVADGVHADAVAQQRAAGALARGVHGDHGDLEAVGLVQADAPDQLVGERALARAAGAGDAQHGNGDAGGAGQDVLAQAVGTGAVFQGGDEARQGPARLPEIARRQGLGLRHPCLHRVHVAARQHVVDHALQAHDLAVLGGVDARHAVVVQFADLGGYDHPAAAAEHLDVLATPLPQQIHHVLEVLHVAALVGGHGDALHVLLERRRDDVFHGAVVAQVDHLGAARLQDAAHDVDGGVVAVEQGGGRDEADLVLGLVDGELVADAEIGHFPLPGVCWGWRESTLR